MMRRIVIGFGLIVSGFVSVHSFAETIVLNQPQVLRIPVSRLAPVYANDILALRLSEWVYSLPDLDRRASPEALVNKFKTALENIPAGYQLVSVGSNPESGLKYAFLTPPTTPSRVSGPWVLVFAGTEGIADSVNDLGYAEAQVHDLDPLFSFLHEFSGAQLANETRPPDLLIAGHSLGGALAQFSAFKLSRSNYYWPGKIQMVTWNALGGQMLINQHGVKFEILPGAPLDKLGKRINYFMEGDLVSRLSKHWGVTKKIPVSTLGSSKPWNPLKLHSIATIVEAQKVSSGRAIYGAVSETPQLIKSVSKLLPYGFLLSRLNEDIFFLRNRKKTEEIAASAAEYLRLNRTALLREDQSALAAAYFDSIATWTDMRRRSTTTDEHVVKQAKLLLQLSFGVLKIIR